MLNVIDAVELRQKESAFVDGVRANALALQDAAVIQLVNMLNVEIQPKHARELNRLRTLDPGDYDFYLQAKGYLKRSDQLSNIEYAIVVLDKALRLDPDYAPAHTSLGETAATDRSSL